MLIGLKVISGICISKLIGQQFTSFLCLCFQFGWKHVTFTWFTHVKKHSAAKSDKNIITEGQRSINLLKQLKKILVQPQLIAYVQQMQL